MPRKTKQINLTTNQIEEIKSSPLVLSTTKRGLLNQILLNKFVALVSRGNSPDTVCRYLGLRRETYNNWMKRGEKIMMVFEENDVDIDDESELKEAFKKFNVSHNDMLYYKFYVGIQKAESAAEMRLVDTVHKFAAEDGKLALEVLARRNPRDWGREQFNSKIQITNNSVTIENTQQANQLSDERAKRIIEILEDAERRKKAQEITIPVIDVAEAEYEETE